KDGSYRWLAWTAATFAAEQLIYIFGRDITARKQAEDEIGNLNTQLSRRVTELTEINRELEAFSYSISHDLRAPLRAMEGFASALLDEDCVSKLGQEATDYVHRIVTSSRYMDKLLADLLEYSRLSHTEVSAAPVPLEEVLQESLHPFCSEIEERKALIQVDRPLGAILAHRPTLRQILMNLLANAIKFVDAKKSPSIHIWA